MCMFSGPADVWATDIFARETGNGRQFLVYSMSYRAREELAMVLPLPVSARSQANGVQFIDFSNYTEFFDDLARGFTDVTSCHIRVLDTPLSVGSSLPVLPVGSFAASFVPQPKDFERLDPRFRIPSGAWKQLPAAYQHYGFAVFKLRQKQAKIHPMALSFATQRSGTLFFPTVHLHDGQVHKTAKFDHILYCQSTTNPFKVAGWYESPKPAAEFLRIDKSYGLVDDEAHCYMQRLKGDLANRDTVI